MTNRMTLNEEGQRLLFRHARTHSAWQPGEVSDELLQEIYDLSKWGATEANTNPLRLVFVKSPEAKSRLKPHMDKGNVDKTMTAPVTVIFAQDLAFYENMPTLFPHVPNARSWYEGNEPYIQKVAFRSSSLQAAYFMLAARALGLDCGPMAGFNADGVKQEFFPDKPWTVNFLCNLGYGDPTKLYPRLARLPFEQVAEIV